MSRSRVASVAVALLLVLSAVSGALGPASLAGPASAEQQCTTGASEIEGFLDFLTIADGDNFGIGQDVEYLCADSTEDFSNTTRADVYAGARSLNSSSEVTAAAIDNRLTDARGPAITEAKLAIVNSLNNGTNRTVAKENAKVAIEDYYATLQKNKLAQFSSEATYAGYISSVEYDETGGTDNWIVGMTDTGSEYNFGNSSGDNTATRTYTLVNGSTANYTTVYIGSSFVELGSSSYFARVTGPDNGTTSLVRYSQTNATLNDIRLQSDEVQANVDTYVEGIYDYYAQGEINATDVLSPKELYTSASTDYNSTGYFGYASVELASLGYSGDFNTSHVIQTDASNLDGYNGTGTVNVSGQLFYTGDSEITLETGETYDPANLTGSFVIAYQTANGSGIADVTGSFEILETTNTQTGEEIQNTTTVRYVYETTNSTELAQEIERLKDLRERLQEQDPGGTGIPISTEDKALLGVLAVAVILLITRD